MELVVVLLAQCEGNPSVTGRLPLKGTREWSFGFYFAQQRTNRGISVDLRHHGAHSCDVSVIYRVVAHNPGQSLSDLTTQRRYNTGN